MNLQSLAYQARSLSLFVCLALLVNIGGCGSKPDKSDVVTPPPINESAVNNESAGNSETTSADPPGELELPPGEIPQDTPSDSPDKKAGGLELPDGPLTPPETTSSQAAETVKVQYANWKEIEQAVTSSGRVTVVDIWSTVCAPCLEEFPNLVKLHKEHGKSIQCISVDVDYDGRKSRPPETYEDDVVKFLSNVGAAFPNYISKTPSDDVLDALKVISIPTVLVYDAEGKLVKKFVDAGDGFSYEEDVIPFVTKLAG